jgi:rRNA-processing protein FCF1
MDEGFAPFMDVLRASHEYWKSGLEVIVLGECVNELKKHSKRKDNQEARIEATRALKILRHDKWHGRILEIEKTNSKNNFADNAIYSLASQERIHNRILVITQDKSLAADCRSLNKLDSQKGRYLEVERIKTNGELEINNGEPGYYHNRENAEKNNSRNYSFKERRPLFGRKNRNEVKLEVNSSNVDHPDIIEGDKRICANLNNPNYPTSKKLSDINTQLSALGALKSEEKDKLSLAYTEAQLKAEKAKIELNNKPNVTALTPKVEVFDTKKDYQPKVEPVHLQKPVATKAVNTPKPIVSHDTNRGWHEFGRTIAEAAQKDALHYGVMFRDESIPYIAQIHGPVDVTLQELERVSSSTVLSKVGESKEIKIGSISMIAEKTAKDYKVTLILAPSKPVTSEPKKVEVKETPVVSKPIVTKPVTAPKEVAKPAIKEAKPKRKKVNKVEAKPAPVKVDPLSNKDKVTTPDSSTAVPLGATLIVGIPSDVNKRSYIERKSRREDNATLHAVSKDGKKASEPKITHSKKVTNKKKDEGATKKAKPAQPSRQFQIALEAEKKLNANINNSNYPVANKIKDLEAQGEFIKGLKDDELKKLKYNSKLIASKLAELKK